MKKLLVVLCIIATITLSALAGYVGASLATGDLRIFGREIGQGYFMQTLPDVAPPEEVRRESAYTPNVILDDEPAEYSPTPALVASVADAQRQAQSIPNLVRSVVDSVVEIDTQSIVTSRNRQFVQPGAGSGVIISQDGYIVTNNHVIANADGSVAHNITVQLRNGESHEATLVGRDVETDLAIIKIDVVGLHPAVFGDSGSLVVGETAIAIGNPLGNLGGTVTEGIISALNRDIRVGGETMHVLQTSAAVNQGNSGGGLFNAYGELIGIVNAKPVGLGIEGIGFAIPSNVVYSIVNQLLTYGFVVGRVDFGIALRDITDPFMAFFEGVRYMGLYVARSDADSGLNIGDRIVSIAGVSVSNQAQARAVYLNYEVGDALEVVFFRGGQRMRTFVTLRQAD